MLPMGTRVVFDDVAVRVRPTGPVAGSFTVQGMVMGVSSGVVWSAILEMTGGSLTALTRTVKVRLTVFCPPLAVPPLSWTVTVMMAAPLALATGVNVRAPVEFGLK